jgi:hypothetical protein
MTSTNTPVASATIITELDRLLTVRTATPGTACVALTAAAGQYK